MLSTIVMMMGWLFFAGPNPSTGLDSCSCATVTNLQTSANAGGSITLTWNGPAGANSYQVRYERLGDGYSSSIITSINPSHTYSNLIIGEEYEFQVASVCGTVASPFIGVQDIIE